MVKKGLAVAGVVMALGARAIAHVAPERIESHAEGSGAVDHARASDISAATPAQCAALGITSGVVIQLKRGVLEPGREITLDIPLVDAAHLGERRVERVALAPCSVRSSGYRLIAAQGGKDTPLGATPPRTLRGIALGTPGFPESPGARSAGSVMPEGLYLAIDVPNGAGQERWWLEPLAPRVGDADPGAHVVYRARDVVRGPWRCAESDGGAREGRAGPSFAARASATHYSALVAVEADFEYFARYGSVQLVGDRVELVYNVINLQYERDVDIQHAISTIIVNTSVADPYNEPDTGSMLGEMVQYWNANRAGVARDLAHLFTGKPPLPVIGTALIGVVCTPSAYAVSNVEFNSANLASACDIVAHETGHNWGACHCPCDTPPSTMNPSILGINRFGGVSDDCGTNSVDAIVSHRNTRACLDVAIGASDPPLNDACANARTIDVGTWGWSNRGATGDGPASCAGMSADTWYRFTPRGDGTLTVSTCGTRDASGLDSALGVYAGACGSLAPLACSDNHAGQCAGGVPRRDAFITLPVLRGVTYLIRVGTSGATPGVTDIGLLNLAFSGCAAPANDLCADATPVGDGSFSFSTVCASTDGSIDSAPGCGAFGYQQTGSDAWFRYTPPCAGVANASICASLLDYDARLAIYAAPGGACPTGPFQAIACSDDACGNGPSVSFNASFGDVFLVRVGGFNAAQGNGLLTLRVSPCAADIDDGTGSGARDCAVDINDFLFFINCFTDGGLCGDVDDDGADPSVPDGGTDINDLIYFLTRYELGC